MDKGGILLFQKQGCRGTREQGSDQRGRREGVITRGLTAFIGWQRHAFLKGTGKRQEEREVVIIRGSNVYMLEIHVNVTWTGGSLAKYLKDNFLVYCKLGNDVCQKQVSAIFASGIHTGLGEQAGPCKSHEAAQLAVAVLVVVVDVVGSVLHQQRGIL